MSRYIDLDKVLKRLDILHNATDSNWQRGRDLRLGISLAKKIINELPAEKVQKIKYGEWQPGHYISGIFDGDNFDKCNLCGWERPIDDVNYKTTYDYCPHCGAKMTKEELS